MKQLIQLVSAGLCTAFTIDIRLEHCESLEVRKLGMLRSEGPSSLVVSQEAKLQIFR
jgi:hypothetical protein